MAFDEALAARLRAQLAARQDVGEKRMFGGLAFMVRGHMCLGIREDTLMARVGSDAYEAALREHGARPMDFTGKPMKGYVYVAPAGLAEAQQLAGWVARCLAFNDSLPAK